MQLKTGTAHDKSHASSVAKAEWLAYLAHEAQFCLKLQESLVVFVVQAQANAFDLLALEQQRQRPVNWCRAGLPKALVHNLLRTMQQLLNLTLHRGVVIIKGGGSDIKDSLGGFLFQACDDCAEVCIDDMDAVQLRFGEGRRTHWRQSARNANR